MFNKKEMIDPQTTMFANLAKLTEDDLEMNKLANYNIRCTNVAYIVGKMEKSKDDILMFLDSIGDNTLGYLYFNSISEAEYALRPNETNELFVIHARPLTELGIYDILTKAELKKRLSNCGLIFNFMDDNEVEKANVLTLKQTKR